MPRWELLGLWKKTAISLIERFKRVTGRADRALLTSSCDATHITCVRQNTEQC